MILLIIRNYSFWFHDRSVIKGLFKGGSEDYKNQLVFSLLI
jgi:hypothetical protein